MTVRAMRVALLLAFLPVTGCGTVANLARQQPGAGGVSPFGGVRQDLECIQKAATGEPGFRTHSRSESEHYPRRALMLFCAADLPLSLVGDIVTWPYAVTYSFINQPIPVPPVMISDLTATPPLPVPPVAEPMPTPSVPDHP
jgi:uncharacterized protein YceK